MQQMEKVLAQFLQQLPSPLADAIQAEAQVQLVAAKTVLLQEGQYVKWLPIVLDGLVKVFTQAGDKELLLYFIQPEETCVMSFNAILHQTPSRIVAITETESHLLLLPMSKLPGWVQTYPALHQLMFRLYHQRYTEMLDTVNQLLYGRLEHRVLDYLKQLSQIKHTTILAIRHREIAQDVGSSREVITRVLKKMEVEGWVKQLEGGVELLVK